MGDRAVQQDYCEILLHSRVNGCLLAIIADGAGSPMGGMQASRQVILTARQLFESFVPYKENADELLRQIAHEAHAMIRLNAQGNLNKAAYSTIAMTLLLPGGESYWLHAGDSRIYYFRKRQLLYKTHDHSYIQKLIDQHGLTEKQALTHPHAGVLTSCLGTRAEPVLAGRHLLAGLQAGDTQFLCTDGLWRHFDVQELMAITYALAPRDASQLLIQKARQRTAGKGDNLSLIILKIKAVNTGLLSGGAKDLPTNNRQQTSRP